MRRHPILLGFLAGLLGVALGLGAWRLVLDYRDFCAMRVWVAQMQQLQQAEARTRADLPKQ